MGIFSVYVLECDICLADFDEADWNKDKHALTKEAEEAGWQKTTHEGWMCPKCLKKAEEAKQ
jgi:hypothetical protein